MGTWKHVVRTLILTLGVAAGFGPAGCVARDTNRLGPPPRMPTIDQIVVSVTPATDGDADGQLDTVRVSVHMFDDVYPAPISARGELIFELVEQGEGRQLYRWSFDADDVSAARQRVQAGVVHWFTLRLDPAVASWTGGVTDLRVRFVGEGSSRAIARVHRGVRWGGGTGGAGVGSR